MEKRKFLVSMFNLGTGKSVSMPRVVTAEHSGAAIEEFKKYLKRTHQSAKGCVVMAEEYKGA